MKRYKVLVVFLIVFVFVLSFFVYDVNAITNMGISDNSFLYARKSNYVLLFCSANYLSSDVNYYHLYNGEVDFSVVSDSGVNFSKNVITTNTFVSDFTFGIGSVIVFQLNMQYNGYNSLPLGNYQVQVVFKNALFGVNNYLLNGSFKYKFSILNDNVFYSVRGLSVDFKLVYNNDYNYTSNKASFTMQYTNFSFNYFTLLNTDAVQNGACGGFHLLNYSISNNVVNCSFDNTYETMSNPHYLFWVAHGLDLDGNPVDLSGAISFNINVDTLPKVKNYKVSYVMDGSPCIAGSGGGRLYLYIDYGSGYVLQDVSKWSATITQIAKFISHMVQIKP